MGGIMKGKIITSIVLALLLSACGDNVTGDAEIKETAKQFVARIQVEGAVLDEESSAAQWVRNTYITPDTAILATKSWGKVSGLSKQYGQTGPTIPWR